LVDGNNPPEQSQGTPAAPQATPSGAPPTEERRRPREGGGRPYGGRGSFPARGGGSRPQEGRFRDRDRQSRGDRAGPGAEEEDRFEERVVKINRCATVVKGGRRFSFSALVAVGDREGSVGIGFGKANEVPPSVEKAIKDARKNMVKISLKGHTIPHQIDGDCRTSRVVLVPAVEGTGVIAGAAVRAVVECVGIRDLLSKVYGSTNPINVVKATLAALKRLRDPAEVARLRGVEVVK